jgi:cell division protein FtsL
MMRLNLVLLLGVLLSALYLVNVQYESRRVYSELDRAQSQALKLAAENERLQVEKRAQATSARVESLAKSKLQMRAATPAVTSYVNYTAALPASAAPGSQP